MASSSSLVGPVAMTALEYAKDEGQWLCTVILKLVACNALAEVKVGVGKARDHMADCNNPKHSAPMNIHMCHCSGHQSDSPRRALQGQCPDNPSRQGKLDFHATFIGPVCFRLLQSALSSE